MALMFCNNQNWHENYGLSETLTIIREHVDEMEIYLSNDSQSISDRLSESILRRMHSIHDIAEKIGLEILADLCTRTIDTLTKHDASSPHEQYISAPLRLVVDCIRGILRCIELEATSNEKLPEKLPDFVIKIYTYLLEVLQNIYDKDVKPNEDELPLRILIADDEEMVVLLLEEILEQEGHLVMAVDNGKNAISVVKSGLFDLVFTDINMPGSTGLDVLKETKAASENTEVVIITGFASVQNTAEALRNGAYDYLTKPFGNSSKILSTVNRAREKLNLVKKIKRVMLRLKHRNEELARYAKSLEEALQSVEEKNRALIHADRMATLGTLSAGIAHEINNPTTFIRGNLQTLQKFWKVMQPILDDRDKSPSKENNKVGFIIEETPALIEDMIAGTERICKIVSGLRSFSHQGVSHNQEDTDLEQCMENALQLVHNRLKNEVELTREFSPGIPKVRANSQQITQVFVNLLVNAADAIDHKDDARIVVRTLADEEEVVAEIEDNGPGIPKEIHDKIFNPFFTTKTIGKGTGLGLSILLGIVHDHGGTVDFRKGSEGHGTVFSIHMPVGKGSGNGEHKPCILIIEDDVQNLTLIKNAFRMTGSYKVISARSGEEAFAEIAGQKPDIALLDVMLPDMDGFEILSRLKSSAETADIKVIGMTAMGISGVKERLISLGAESVIFKPFRFHEVFAEVEKLIPEEDSKHGKRVSRRMGRRNTWRHDNES